MVIGSSLISSVEREFARTISRILDGAAGSSVVFLKTRDEAGSKGQIRCWPP